MSEAEPVLLLTRPRESSEDFLGRLRKRLGKDVRAVISPVIGIVDHGPLPSLAGVRTIILSSSHAAHRLGRAGRLRERRVFTVGETTASVARSYGADARSIGEDASGLVANATILEAPCLHCRGAHTRGDIAERLNAKGIRTTEAVIYDQVAIPLAAEASDLFGGSDKIIAPLFSPRSAELLARQVSGQAPMLAVAISPATASSWGKTSEVLTVGRPTADEMLAAVAVLF